MAIWNKNDSVAFGKAYEFHKAPDSLRIIRNGDGWALQIMGITVRTFHYLNDAKAEGQRFAVRVDKRYLEPARKAGVSLSFPRAVSRAYDIYGKGILSIHLILGAYPHPKRTGEYHMSNLDGFGCHGSPPKMQNANLHKCSCGERFATRPEYNDHRSKPGPCAFRYGHPATVTNPFLVHAGSMANGLANAEKAS